MAQRRAGDSLFADGIRLEGLKILAQHQIKEGIAACVNYITTQIPGPVRNALPN